MSSPRSFSAIPRLALLGSLTIMMSLLLLLAITRSASAQSDNTPSPNSYPLMEEFSTPASLTITDTAKIAIEDGKVIARVQGRGEQYAYREIPSFSGDVRITVRGQVNDWENNCAVYTGIGDGLKSGVALSYGFFGGGCPVQGSLIDAFGVLLDHDAVGCDWIGPWLWVEPKRPYEAILTIVDDMVDLSVSGVGNVTGTLQYDGVYSMLFVGDTGRSISSNFCSVDIDSVEIEPLGGAIIAISDLSAVVAYPTQVDLNWTHDIPDAAAIRVERREAGRSWQEITAASGKTTGYEDNGVTCGMTYEYRADVYMADGRHTGYSNVAGATMPACVSIFEEDWESGIRPERWTAYGSPAPHVEAGEGPDGSMAFEPNGDGNFHSGVISNRPFDITSGISVDYWMKGAGTLAEKYSSTSVFLTSCGPSDNLEEECRQFTVRMSGSTEFGVVVYGVQTDEEERFQEDWEPLDGAWHHYRFHVKPDGLVDFYRDGERVFTSTKALDFTENSLLYLHITGKSQTGDWHMDNLRVSAPAAPEWHVKVVDEEGRPVANAAVFADGQPLGSTSQAGMIQTEALPEGLELAAISAVETAPSVRGKHDGWSYATHVTSITREGEDLRSFTVAGPGEQRLVLRRDYPLVLFNMVVSVEWDATEAYLQQIARAARLASDHLFDLTDGQMAFGNVDIYSNGEQWAEADIQISTKNIVRPHAYIGGILEEDTSHIIRIGRGWDGVSGNQGDWDQPAGFRTLVHEFGHYALYLYDEYVAYEFDKDENVIGELPAFCPAEADQNADDESVRASAMYDGYRATELSAFNVPGLWSSACEGTLHYQYTQQSAWETIVETYADRADPPRWRIVSPIDRQSVLAGPTEIPSFLPAWPTVEVHLGAAPEPPRSLTVLDPARNPAANVIVALYRQSGVQVIGQGLTNEEGQLLVYGANEGDTIRVASFDGGLTGDSYVGEESDLMVLLKPVSAILAQNVAFGSLRAIPHMRVIAEPGADGGQIDLLFALNNFDADADLGIAISEPGDEVGRSPVMAFSPATGTYRGQISFAATERGMGRVRVFGSMPSGRVRMHATYRLQRVGNGGFSDVYSNDGNFHLKIDAGSLPADEAYFVVMPPGAIPGPLPVGMTLVGDPYDVTASGALAMLEKPAVLAMHYDKHLLPNTTPSESMDIHRWDPFEGEWVALGSEMDEGQGALVTTVRALGVYAVLVPCEPGSTYEMDRGSGG